MSLEALQESGIFKGQSEKTFIDKLLAKEEVNRIRELVRKNDLTRSDLLEILDLLSGNEAKLLNLGKWERYVLLKFFVWIREFVKVHELFYDYEEDMIKREEEGKLILTDRTKQLFKNIKRQNEHNIKFLIDLYLNISRTTLSLGATGLLEFLKNKFEMDYKNHPSLTPQAQQSGGWFK